MNQLRSFDWGLQKNMQKAAHPLVSVDHGDGMVFVRSFVPFVWFLTRDSSVGLLYLHFRVGG